MIRQWFVRTSKANRGPFSTAKLRRLVDEGKVKLDSLISRDGEKWIKASQVRGLKFGETQRSGNRQAHDAPSPESEHDAPTHIPWYEGQSAAKKTQDYSRLSTGDLREGLTSNAESFIARMRYSGSLAALATAIVYFVVRVCYRFGVIEVTTTASTLTWRIGLPAAVFVAVFAFLYWSTRGGPSGPIDPDMSDDEIARML